MLAWQMGIPPGQLSAIDFRHKILDAPSSHYGIEATGCCGSRTMTRIRSTLELYGYNWGYGFLKYNACDYCDDVVGETADISIGDAWLPQYTCDSAGTNILVVRTSEIDLILREASDAGRIRLDRIGIDVVVRSQDAGLRHRRDGLAYRLYLKDSAGDWRPPKRVTASAAPLDARQKQIHNLRMVMAIRSHSAFRSALIAGDFNVFVTLMSPFVKAYESCYRRPFWRRIGGRILRFALRVTGR